MRSRALLVLALVGAALRSPAAPDSPLVPAAPGIPSPSSWYGTRIASISFRGDAPIDEGYAARIVTLRTGGSLTDIGVKETLRNLYATQWFSDLWVEVAGATDATDVVIAYFAAPRIRTLTVVGKGVPSRSALYDRLGISRGDFWDTDRGRSAVEAALRFLKERGCFEARIGTEVDMAPNGTSVDVRFVVATGPEARAAAPSFDGDLGPVASAELIRTARLKAGKPYRQLTARRDAERFAALYRKRGFARAEVRFESDRYEAGRRVATATYAVFVGPRLVLVVEGASEKEIRNHPGAPWAKGEAPDEDSIRKFAGVLRNGYQESGYARASVNVRFEASPAEEKVFFTIKKGGRFAVEKVAVQGNESIPSARILSLLGTRPRGTVRTGRLVDSLLEADRAAIESLYRSKGFTKARSGEPIVRDGASPFMLDVTFPVLEGVKSIVGDVSIVGAATFSVADLEARLGVKRGEPYRPAAVDNDVAVLRSFLSERGFVRSQVDAVVTPLEGAAEEPGRVAVKYAVFEGDQFRFGKTIIRGNRVTRVPVVEREFAYKEGDPLAFGKIAETQQRLARLGIFQRIDMGAMTPTPGVKEVPLLLTVSETKPWSFLYGVGAEYDSIAQRQLNPRLSLGVSYYNLLGRAITTSFEARYSRRDTRILATVKKRSIFDDVGPVSLTVFRADQVFPTYRVYRLGTFVELERRFTEKTRATLRYQYEIVEPTADDPSILSTLERQDQQIAISSIGSALIRDTRDDPAAPRKGWFLLADSKYAFSLFRANARFLKAQAQVATFQPAGGSVVAASVRVGAISSFATCNQVATPSCPPNLEVPIVERFFAGGRTTHRAFTLDNLGIEGETLKGGQGIGGNALVIANVEWRIPVFGDLGVALLFDAGNVWADPSHVRAHDIRYGAGLGLSYMTPVGPLRLEYGYKLDRKPGEDVGALNFSVGYPF